MHSTAILERMWLERGFQPHYLMKMDQQERSTHAQTNSQPYAGISPQLIIKASFLLAQWHLPTALTLSNHTMLWTLSTANQAHLPLQLAGAQATLYPARSQPQLLQAAGPSCTQVKQISGFHGSTFPPPIPQELPLFFTAKLCKYFRLETGGDTERITIHCSTGLTISCQ